MTKNLDILKALWGEKFAGEVSKADSSFAPSTIKITKAEFAKLILDKFDQDKIISVLKTTEEIKKKNPFMGMLVKTLADYSKGNFIGETKSGNWWVRVISALPDPENKDANGKPQTTWGSLFFAGEEEPEFTEDELYFVGGNCTWKAVTKNYPRGFTFNMNENCFITPSEMQFLLKEGDVKNVKETSEEEEDDVPPECWGTYEEIPDCQECGFSEPCQKETKKREKAKAKKKASKKNSGKKPKTK